MSLPCNCGHSKEEHKLTRIPLPGESKDFLSLRWCIYSEFGKCPCDYYTEMNNLEYLEWCYASRISV